VIPCEAAGVRSPTCDLGNDINSGCGLTGVDAMDVWWEISLNPGGEFTAEVQCEWTDVVLWVMSRCDPATWTCLDYADDTDDQSWPIVETVTYMNPFNSIQSVYLVIDGYNAGECDDCMITFTCTGGVVSGESTAWSELKAIFR
jgi:hypothetical protein